MQKIQEIQINRNNYFELLAYNFIYKNIFIDNNLKNYNLLINLLKIFANNNIFLSAREIHKNLNNNGVKVSHITVIEYIDYILKSGLVEKIYRKDLKLDKTSSGKAIYIFKNVEYRIAIGNNKNIINENIVYSKLIELGKSGIYTGKNGTFNFSFLFNDIIIHVSKNGTKNEIKKEINKLLKIEGNFKKYLIINSIKESGIRPSTYLPLKILEIDNFIKDIEIID